MKTRGASWFCCTGILVLIGAFAAAQSPKRAILPYAVFELRGGAAGPGIVVQSEDGKGLAALSLTVDGSTHFATWDLSRGFAHQAGIISTSPIPHNGGCIVGATQSPRHPPIHPATWDTFVSPVLDWVHGQAIDLHAKTQHPIRNHPGWDAWEDVSIVPGWSLNSLCVKSINSANEVEFIHHPEWKSTSIKSYFLWSQTKQKGFEAISGNGKWIAFSCSFEPLQNPDETPGPSKLAEGPCILRIWSVGNPTPIHRIVLERKAHALEFSPSGSYLIVTQDQGLSEIWNTRSGIRIGEFRQQVRRMIWNKDEDAFFLMDPFAGILREFQTATQKEVRTIQLSPGPAERFDGLTFSPTLRQAVGWRNTLDEQDRHSTTFFLFRIPRSLTTERSSPAVTPTD